MKVLALTLFFASLPSPVVTREQLVPMEAGLTTAAAEAIAGNFIVAGTSASAAWARKFSADGKTLWEYTNSEKFVGYPARIATYSGIASMPDGSTFLCGRSPLDPSSTESAALLTHVDMHGKRLYETHVAPGLQAGTRASLSVFRGCWASGSHVILHGDVLRIKADGAAPGQATQWLWFVAVDETGHVAWQREVSVTPFFVCLESELLQVGDQLIFSGTSHQKTELIRLSTSGEVLGRMTLGGSYHLVRNLQGEPKIELWGANGGPGQLIRFTSDLKEIARITGPVPMFMSTSKAYRLSDGTLCLFGSSVHSFGQRIRPVIVHVDATLRAMETLEPSWDSIGVIINLQAVAPLGSDGAFISAVGLLNKAHSDQNDGRNTSTRASLALDYIHLK